MAHLPSLGSDAVLLDVFRRFPAPSAPLLDYHQALLRGESPFTVAQRELIAAYVSALNACTYCHGVHSATAAAFGMSEDLVSALLADVRSAPIEEPMKPVLELVRTLTLTPSRVTDAEVDAVYTAGWGEQALHDAVSVCALFNLMNRLVEGLGISAGADYFRTASRRLAGEGGYAGLRAALGEDQPEERDHQPQA
ncbi:carboxymuconolactone decarboxylase family protein [Pseudonocardia nigra]|uniref:carboxymuconolactone decarboxylase family protein n=1 Tax=Pseudonocardia nigra TaxID=1921578 RepID=UPI001C601219|nr:peroxidase-related enzyme [Pseudonocardia nigra]